MATDRRGHCRGWRSNPVHLKTADANGPMDDGEDMRITYRGTGGLGALIALAAIALAAGVLTAAVAIFVVAGIAGAAVLVLVRAVLPRAWRRRPVPSATDWPHDTIEGTVVDTVVSPAPHRAEEVRQLASAPARSRPERADERRLSRRLSRAAAAARRGTRQSSR